MLQLLRELAKLGEKKQVGVCLFQRQLPVEPRELDLLIRDVDPCVGDPGVSISRTHARKGALVFCASHFQDYDLPRLSRYSAQLSLHLFVLYANCQRQKPSVIIV